MDRKKEFYPGNGDHLTVTVTDIAMPGDRGVAKADGLVVFIPGTIPGDEVTVRIGKRQKRYAYGEVVSIVTPSPHRTDPACPHFERCGGCTIQSMEYTKQLELKNAHLRQTLRRIGRIDMPESIFDDITPSPERYRYRSKVELAFGDDGRAVVCGMYEASSSEASGRPGVVSVPECMIFNASLKEIVVAVEDFAHGESYSAYDELTKRGHLRHLIVRQSKATGALMVILEVNAADLTGMASLYDRLKREVPQVAGLHLAVNRRPGPYIDYGNVRCKGGDPFIEETVSNLTMRVYPASFFQPNPRAAELLYGKIGDLAATLQPGSVLGLYCGMGPIELLISRSAGRVTGVDSLRTNIDNARENAMVNGIGNCSFITGRVEETVKAKTLSNPDLVVIDPPRSGVSPRGIELINALSPKTIFYVSCNPATLARDLGNLVTRGFRVEKIAPFDFFPHTSHLETLAVLGKKR